MNGFSQEEFNRMYNEFVRADEVSSTMLCSIIGYTLFQTVRRWCYDDPFLNTKEDLEDIMQEINVRIVKKYVTAFKSRNDRNNSGNNSHEEFRSWMFAVALNIEKDFSNRRRK